jgi:hypothetical protein
VPKFTGFKVSLSLPYIGGVEGVWEPDEDEKKAPWEMYVELVTRISVAELGPEWFEILAKTGATGPYGVLCPQQHPYSPGALARR